MVMDDIPMDEENMKLQPRETRGGRMFWIKVNTKQIKQNLEYSSRLVFLTHNTHIDFVKC